jgi:two-component system CheB/CheR fusion protein
VSALRVLVVDDNVDSAGMMETYLGLIGHEVEVAYDGAAALACAATFAPHVVLVDLRLPDLDGFELARRLRAMPGLETATLVAMSGLSDEEAKRRAQACGIRRFFVKPVDLTALEAFLGTLS